MPDLQAEVRPFICIIDPDAATRRSLTKLLARLDTDIQAFGSAEEFLAELRSGAPPACVIAEVALPGMSGLELLGELTSLPIKVPTILLAARGEVASAVAALRGGAAEYFKKPTPDRALYRAVANLLRSPTAIERRDKGSSEVPLLL